VQLKFNWMVIPTLRMDEIVIFSWNSFGFSAVSQFIVRQSTLKTHLGLNMSNNHQFITSTDKRRGCSDCKLVRPIGLRGGAPTEASDRSRTVTVVHIFIRELVLD